MHFNPAPHRRIKRSSEGISFLGWERRGLARETQAKRNGFSRACEKSGGRDRAFTLVEILVVILIMVLIMALAIPAMNSLKGAGDVTKAVYDIKGILDQARTYAIANNTYTWVGFFEEDGSKISATPAVPSTGRVVVATVAAKNGMRGYDLTNPPANLDATNLVSLGKLQKFDSLHLAPLNGFANQAIVTAIPSTSGMARPWVESNNYDIGNPACGTTPIAGFSWPLVVANPSLSQYAFSKVINFNPQGMAHIQYASNTGFIPLYIEIGLQTARGSVAPAAPTDQTKGNQAAIQIDGMTGATRIYRP